MKNLTVKRNIAKAMRLIMLSSIILLCGCHGKSDPVTEEQTEEADVTETAETENEELLYDTKTKEITEMILDGNYSEAAYEADYSRYSFAGGFKDERIL